MEVGDGGWVGATLDEIIKRRRAKKEKISLQEKIGMSLDEIIKESNGGGSVPLYKREGSCLGGEEEEVGQESRKRKREDEDDDFLTPSECIVLLTNRYKLVIEVELSKQLDHGLGRSHNWKAIVKCGELKAECDAALKDLAKQAASYELVKLLQIHFPEREFPSCKIPEGCFYDPIVIEKFLETVENHGLDNPIFETTVARKYERDYYTTTFFVGDDEFHAHSMEENHSKIMAAKAGYENYSQKKFPRDKYHVMIGEESARESKFKWLESEAVHAITISPTAVKLHSMAGSFPKLTIAGPSDFSDSETLDGIEINEMFPY